MIDEEERLKRIEHGDKVFFDDVLGIAGTTYPIGTPGMPSSVIADVITICGLLNIRTISVRGALTLGAAMEHYNFVGYEHEDVTDILDLSDEDVDGSHVEGLIVTGGQGGTGFLTLIRCIVNAVTDFNGRMNWCSFWGGATSSFKDAGYIDLVDCESIYGAVTITVQAPTRASIKNWRGNLILTLQDGGTCYVRGFKGTLEIDEMTAGTLNVYANGADITINADCSGGTINIYGNARVTDNSGATVVNDYTKETQLDVIEGAIASIAGGAFYGSYGPKNVEVDNDVDLGIILYDPSGNIITTGEITPGTHTVHRIRGAVDTEILGSTASSEAAGRVYMTYAFPAASWNVGDIFYVTFIGISVTLDGITTDYPNLFIWGRVVREPDISTKIDDIEAKLDTGGLGVGLVTKALTFANQTGQVNLFTVTGDVIVRIVAVVKTGCATGTACNVSVGIAADVDAIIPVTDITLLAAQEIWHDATPDSEIEALGSMREHIVSEGNDITLNSSAADNSGAITFYCFWTALSSGATVAAA